MQILVEKDSNWLGPFTVVQLQTIDWLTPKTKLRIEDGDEILNGDEIPTLNHFFQEKSELIPKMRRLCPICRQWLIAQEL